MLHRIIAEALAAPTAKPGKVIVVGFSLGGGASLVCATAMQKRTRDRLAQLSPLS